MIDWFTFCAQIINFTILVLLLKRFLYKPLLEIMDNRELEIKELYRKAEDLAANAEREKTALKEKIEELECSRASTLERIEEEAEQLKNSLLKEARDEVETLRQSWRKSLIEESRQLGGAVKEEFKVRVLDTSRKIIAELSDADLEERIIARFFERLETTGMLGELNNGKGRPGSILVRTGFPLGGEKEKWLRGKIEEQFGSCPEIKTEIAEELIAGIEMVVDGKKASWSLSGYLEDLENGVVEVIRNG